ncbi:MAG: DUF2203 domain-containing protein [Acidobacteria bacterium]|nr:DUF2203 domain-containing protein [Acidobacteriota bacterium]
MEARRFTVVQANEALPALRDIVGTIQDRLTWLGAHKPEFRYAVREMKILLDAPVSPDYFERLLEIKAALGEVDSMGCQIKDVRAGLVDFPARLYGKEVLLCWKVGEDSVAYYHDLESGYSGRRPIPDEARGPEGATEGPSEKNHS